ncbi:methionine ABC transporter permease MetI, partial [Enterobacter ludwigii]|uniref:methionine ABC transporter permease MetI n=1 Tax=Enterobacter ludwigii TaxID=299767 RepID=UPI002E27D8FC
GLQAGIVPVTVGASPVILLMVEKALLEIPTGIIEASSAMGARRMQIVRKVLLPAALPGLVNAATITLITLVGYTAMGGAVGDGGLGQIGYQYGYIGYNATVMNTVLVLLVILVYLIQFAGDRIVRAVTRK